MLNDDWFIYTIADTLDQELGGNEWALVWAYSEAEALRYAKFVNNWEVAKVVCEESLSIFKPQGPLPCEEHRLEVMRVCMWQNENDTRCESCDLASMGESVWEVCEECGRCPDCAANYQCDYCHGQYGNLDIFVD